MAVNPRFAEDQQKGNAMSFPYISAEPEIAVTEVGKSMNVFDLNFLVHHHSKFDEKS